MPSFAAVVAWRAHGVAASKMRLGNSRRLISGLQRRPGALNYLIPKEAPDTFYLYGGQKTIQLAMESQAWETGKLS